MGKKNRDKRENERTIKGFDALGEKLGLSVPEKREKEKDWARESQQYGRNGRSARRSAGAANVRRKEKTTDKIRNDATAPYNFIPLPKKILPSPLEAYIEKARKPSDVPEKYREYILENGKYSGYIDLSITTKSPCFIGGGDEEFFAPLGRPLIPGSSIRGMVKNLFKIVTCGAMRGGEDFTDRHLYSRGLASEGSFGSYYTNRMTEKKTIIEADGKGKKTPKEVLTSKAQGGFLLRIKDKYYICPAEGEARKFEDKNDSRAKKAAIEYHDEDSSASCYTGAMQGKKHYYLIANANWNRESWLEVDAQTIDDYKADKTRRGLDLFKKARKGASAAGFAHDEMVELVVPCYYVAAGGHVCHFGHGRYYRIPYEKSISDHIAEAVKEERAIDFAETVFGSKERWAGRVFFDDAALEDSDAAPLEKEYPRPLMSPNPTSFQLYLVQKGKKLLHWDDDTPLRGYKMYWHSGNDTGQWKKKDSDKLVDKMKRIQPLPEGATFKGKIRFQDLSAIELGALCRVFHLADDGAHTIYYKLGQGKSIGMGSVAIEARLYRMREDERYSGLFTDRGWKDGIEEEKADAYLKAFEEYRDRAMSAEEKERYEEFMKDLRLMLDWKNTARTGWADKIKAMPLTTKEDNAGSFKKRSILPAPREVLR